MIILILFLVFAAAIVMSGVFIFQGLVPTGVAMQKGTSRTTETLLYVAAGIVFLFSVSLFCNFWKGIPASVIIPVLAFQGILCSICVAWGGWFSRKPMVNKLFIGAAFLLGAVFFSLSLMVLLLHQ